MDMTSNKTLLRLFILLGIFIVLPICADYPREYSAEAIQAKVVDAKTKKPLEGVIVTANWQLESGNVGGVIYVGQMMVMETVTDKDGKFTFPAWGPKPLKKGLLLNHDPQLLLFKPGYRYLSLQNTFEDKMYLKPVRRSEWDGKMIELKPFKGMMEEWANQLGFLITSLRFVEDDCNWKKTPRIILALDGEKERLRKAGIIRTFYSISYLPTDEKKCGSPQEFFRGYQP